MSNYEVYFTFNYGNFSKKNNWGINLTDNKYCMYLRTDEKRNYNVEYKTEHFERQEVHLNGIKAFQMKIVL